MSPVIAQAFIPSIVPKQLMPYIMCESNCQATPSAATGMAAQKPSGPALKAQRQGSMLRITATFLMHMFYLP